MEVLWAETMSLSSSKAEYLAIAEIYTEIILICNLLCFLGVKIKYPIVVRCDNVGAIFLGYNTKMSQRTKHVDIKAHFIRGYVDQGILKIIFVKSEDNVSDILWTKNTDQQTFQRHIVKFMNTQEEEKKI